MPAFRFVHAADLHLDAAFAGVSRDLPPRLADRLHRATFTAWERLVDLCLAELPDALLIAGDVHNHEDGSLRAQVALRDGCARLAEAGVRVFIAHGNHDPLTSRVKSLRWPDGVTVFGPQAEAYPVTRDGRVVAVVHGVSHETDREGRNLAKRFARAATVQALLQGTVQDMDVPPGAPQIGVLHCNVGTTPGSRDAGRYAPCTLDDLAATGLDYWALGHIHLPQVLRTRPHVVYPGSTQGLHINEDGPRGCQLVTVHDDGEVELEFRPLAPVRWQVVEVTIGNGGTGGNGGNDDDGNGAASLETLHGRILEAMERAAGDDAAAGAPSGMPSAFSPVEATLFRVVLHGRGPLDRHLRRPGVVEGLLEMLREAGASLAPLAWVKDIELRTRPDVDMDALRQRDDLLGEVLRVAAAARGLPEPPAGDPTACPAGGLAAASTNGQPPDVPPQPNPAALRALAAAVLAPLYDGPRGRRFLGPTDALTPEDLAALLDDAERICCDMLEAD
ncbi:DNA repair exonuclease [Nitratidesulfovibrio sp. HK-II]|uniref:DNA repair exonuclease n=1 Tax=Nitratidesulfovibrio sp. HK-II TaxID=2009266 RepID=UPI000E2ED211|nr:DNA repair exonuclease [Nitratidesulfovibrio sp. HK-II]GBO97157.1 DNA double-strand break repair protein Mre11 [Nitratidesulfovibrio sp. HK-II]